MFGYVQANVKELKVREYEEYRSYYCGLCHELKKRYGRRGQLLLSYDMTFLFLLLSALYEPEEKVEQRRCLPHPTGKHAMVSNKVTAYAADMTILLGYRKAADDWQDEHAARARTLMLLLEKDYRKAALLYPRQAGALGRCVNELAEAERAGCRDLDRVAGLTGVFLGEMFAWEKDLWEEDLRKTGFYLGKFIYMMDAWDDREKDRKKGSYNVFNLLEDEGRLEQPIGAYALSVMQDTMACCCRSFEKLPIVEKAPILRNILYAGVWVKYGTKMKEKNKDEKPL